MQIENLSGNNVISFQMWKKAQLCEIVTGDAVTIFSRSIFSLEKHSKNKAIDFIQMSRKIKVHAKFVHHIIIFVSYRKKRLRISHFSDVIRRFLSCWKVSKINDRLYQMTFSSPCINGWLINSGGYQMTFIDVPFFTQDDDYLSSLRRCAIAKCWYDWDIITNVIRYR